jgi:hypothetical protein
LKTAAIKTRLSPIISRNGLMTRAGTSPGKPVFDKAARQTAYLLTNKILFYNLLQNHRPGELDPLEIPAGLTKGSLLQSTLVGIFQTGSEDRL